MESKHKLWRSRLHINSRNNSTVRSRIDNQKNSPVDYFTSQ
ncbi:hypothetical protein [Nostoc sp.]